MKVKVPKGKHVLAVSGGVDSMVLLDLLAKSPNVELVVAHFNHNIRQDSPKDEALVNSVANTYDLPFEAGRVPPGTLKSEAAARNARYSFLSKVLTKHRAQAIITAHHQDDMIETALINLLRGTHRRGISSIINNKHILRPMLGVSKDTIRTYAISHRIQWIEDETNQDTSLLRNYLRLRVLNKLNPTQRAAIVRNIEKIAKINLDINKELATISQTDSSNIIDRQLFSSMSIKIGNELLAYNFKTLEITDYDSTTINRLSMAIRTARAKSVHHVNKNVTLELSANQARLITP
jgi:tRNA(Ile)-lysidine synthase